MLPNEQILHHISSKCLSRLHYNASIDVGILSDLMRVGAAVAAPSRRVLAACLK